MAELSVASFRPQSVTVVENGAAPHSSDKNPDTDGKKGGFSFGDFIDTINPLHHIPIVGQIYRAVTGDQISDNARLAGGGLFAGPLGIGIASASIAMRKDKATADMPAIAEQNGQLETHAPQQALKPALDPRLKQYDAIAREYWTQDNLRALSASLSLDAPEAAKDEDAESYTDRVSRAPVAEVSRAAPLANAAAPVSNSAVFAQMLGNLEKLDAQRQP